MKCSIWILFLVLGSPAVFATDLIEYDRSTKTCLNAAAEPDRYLSQLRSCGLVRKLKKSKWRRIVEHRKDGDYSLQFRGIRIQESDLRSSDFEDLDLEGAVFSNSDFRNSSFRSANLRNVIFDESDVDGADFSSADLRGTSFGEHAWVSASFKAALVDESTSFGGALSCEQIQEAELVWKSPSTSPCEIAPLEMIEMNSDFMNEYPGSLVFAKADQVMVFGPPKAQFQPMSLERVSAEEFGLNSWDYFEILCAAKISSCLKSRTAVANSFELRRLPGSLLESGIEFYHGRSDELERKGIARFIGFAEISIENDRPTQEVLKAVAKALGKDMAQIEAASWMDHLDQVSAMFHFLPQPQTNTFCEGVRNPETLELRIKCRIIIDQESPEAEVEQWMKQLTQGWVRAAQTSTASLNFRLSESLSNAIVARTNAGADLGFVVPVRNINFWEVQDVYRRASF